VQAYRFKCRAKREMKDIKALTSNNGRPATQGFAWFAIIFFSSRFIANYRVVAFAPS